MGVENVASSLRTPDITFAIVKPYKTPFDKSTIEQVHIKFCKQSLNVPWYKENIACGAELGWYPLSIDIKASIFSYWQRLKHSTNNVLLREAFQYATKIHLSSTFNRMKKSIKPSGINIYRTGLKPRIDHQKIQEKNLHKRKFKNNYQFENYLTLNTKPAHRISLTRLRLGCHALRIQTGKSENRGALIPVEERTCLVCKEDCIEHEHHFLMYCRGYTTLRRELHSHISNVNTHSVPFTVP